jgi:hypothetical protein
MNPFGIIEDEILGKLSIEELVIGKKVHMIVNELLLDGSVVPLSDKNLLRDGLNIQRRK